MSSHEVRENGRCHECPGEVSVVKRRTYCPAFGAGSTIPSDPAATRFELIDAIRGTAGPVRSLAELSPAAEHGRGHGPMYAVLNRG